MIARDAVVGQPVTPEQVLASIADLSEVWFLGRVFEKDLGHLLRGADAEVQLNAYPTNASRAASSTSAARSIPVARTVTARIRLHKPRRPAAHRPVRNRARLDGGRETAHARLVVIPRSALDRDRRQGRRSSCGRATATSSSTRSAVGDAALGKVEVLSGLREGEQVVVEGVFTLKSVVLKSTFGEEE